MTYRLDLRNLIRQILTDPVVWPDATINLWIKQAIRDYSNYFPQLVSTTINCVADQRVYSLTSYTGIREVIEVEYPDGEDPPRYLYRLGEKHPRFIDGQYYDVRISDVPLVLVLGEEPASGEQIAFTYQADHTIPTQDSDTLTMPDRHLEALVLFCQWIAIRELEMNEAAEPDDSNIVLSMLGLNSGRADRLYRAKIREYQETESPGGLSGPWVMDRVY